MSEEELSPELEELLSEVSVIVRDELVPPAEGGDELNLTGLEGLIIGLALRAMVGALSGFVGRSAYDRWKAARTRRQLRDVAVALDLRDAEAGYEIDQETIEHELATQLMDQG